MSSVLQRKIDGTGPGAVEVLAVEGSGGTESASWQIVENVGTGRVYTRNVGVYFSLERAKAKQFLKDAEKEKWEEIQGEWQQESPAKEYLDQVKSSADTDSTPEMMRFGYYAFKDRDWDEYKRTFKVEVNATEWASERIREAFEKSDRR